MREDKDKNDRPEAYPKPTATDNQLNNQPEYIDQQPNTYEEDISDLPADKSQGLKDSDKGGE
jgi:hypothetical protein